MQQTVILCNRCYVIGYVIHLSVFFLRTERVDNVYNICFCLLKFELGW